MGNQCSYCGNHLPVTYRLLRKDLHPECAQEQAAMQARYEARVIQAADALSLANEIRAELSDLASQAKLSQEARHAKDQALYDGISESFLEDSYLSDQERRFLSEAQTYFGLSDIEANSAKLDKIRQLTDIADGNLPVVDTSVRLQKGEIAHYEGPAKWSHLKTRKRRVAGTRSSNVRIAKGVRVKIPGSSGYTQEWEEFVTVDEGKAVVTSKRLLFMGAKKNLNVKLDKIMELEYFADAVRINRGTVSPTYFFLDDPSLFYVVLSTVMEGQEAYRGR